MISLYVLAQVQPAAPVDATGVGRWIPVFLTLVLIPLVPLTSGILRRAWLGGVSRTSLRLERATRRVETVLAFLRSIAYFVLAILLVFFSVNAVWPEFNPLAATGALSIVALILTGMFKDVVVDVVKGLDILFGGHYDVGDFIEVGSTCGHVMDFQLKYTKLRTPSGEEVVLNNSKCIPSKRFRRGVVTNHVSIPLQNSGDQQAALKVMDRVASEIDHQVEAVQDRPTFEEVLPLPATGGIVLRYSVHVLPGARWVMDDVCVPLITRSLSSASIPLSGDITYFHMNDISTFRKLFNRNLTRNEIEQWMDEEKQSTAEG